MSEPKCISPLLDGFTLGAPISEHHGVSCYPAIKENTNKKYIVKLISVPASQSQFDAMLLAGAYKDPADTMEYFRQSGEDILKEAELLKNLSRLEGFLPYDGWQMEPITKRRLGYEIYLVGSYKRSLEKYIRKNPVTHLQAVNLGLDLCAALTVCRQAGFLYADLKPSNIYISEKKEFRIGDLGFLSLDALRYASLPERYFSPYTPPELLDPMTAINLSVDTYAVGMILYQLYNDGRLPFRGISPEAELPSPCHADYEMAEIIMKAIHPDPQQRWTDPKDLGKAIASYMQRNSVNDIPITPFIPLDVPPENITAVSAAEDIHDSQEQPSDPVPAEAAEQETSQSTESIDIMVLPPQECHADQDVKAEEGTELQTEEIDSLPEPDPISDVVDQNSAEESETTQTDSENNVQSQESEESISFTELTEDVAKILSRANEIISHEIPEETLFPVEAPVPDPFAFAAEEPDSPEEDLPVEPLMEDETSDGKQKKNKKAKHYQDPAQKNKFRKFFSRVFIFLLTCAVGVGGYWYYQNIYLQTIDSIAISGTQDQITVLIDTSIEESRLVVHCTDGNGKRQSESVQGGKAVFSSLSPSTQYTIQLDMNGFYKLVGKTSDVFTTEAPTRILSFQAIAGTEDGSVKLDFTVDGKDPDFWNIRYVCEGEEERLETVTGHNAMITGLTVGKVYTFSLDGGKNFDLSGETSIQYLASKLILAENLSITSSNGSDITVNWSTPGDVVVENWNVRCYDGYGFEEQVTVTENQVSFSGIDPATKYTVEITASGMTQPARISITSDPINLSDFQVDETPQTKMNITWKYSGNQPEGGWLLIYTVDGSGSQVIECSKASAEISPLIPGAKYEFVVQAADSRTVFNNAVSWKAKDAEKFTQYNFVLEDVSFHLLKTPAESGWSYETVSQDSFTNTFQAGESVSMVLSSSSTFYLPGNKTNILFVFRDSFGNVLPELTTETSLVWKNIWLGGDSKNGEIDIPKLPAASGSYVMELYFDGCYVTEFEITLES